MKIKFFTLVELLVIISIIGILSGLSIPAYNAARKRAHISNCLNNLKQIGICIHQYAVDYSDFLPACERFSSAVDVPTIWNVLSRYGNRDIFRCPSDRKDYLTYSTSYEWNSFVNGQKLDRNLFVVGTVAIIAPLCGDANDYHKGSRNYLYSDGHVSDSFELMLKTE
jgi:prepilin-type processing-associated H-X9-DG protein